jgi:hypothetical protein
MGNFTLAFGVRVEDEREKKKHQPNYSSSLLIIWSDVRSSITTNLRIIAHYMMLTFAYLCECLAIPYLFPASLSVVHFMIVTFYYIDEFDKYSYSCFHRKTILVLLLKIPKLAKLLIDGKTAKVKLHLILPQSLLVTQLYVCIFYLSYYSLSLFVFIIIIIIAFCIAFLAFFTRINICS